MDFHAVCEAWMGDSWHVVDNGADITLDEMQIWAVADVLPRDDWSSLRPLR